MRSTTRIITKLKSIHSKSKNLLFKAKDKFLPHVFQSKYSKDINIDVVKTKLNYFAKSPITLREFNYLNKTLKSLNQEDLNKIFYQSHKGKTLLHNACENNDIRVSKLALKYYNVNEKDSYGCTPLELALRYGYIKIAELILGNENFKYEQVPSWNNLLCSAVKNNKIDIVKLLLKHGFDIDQRNEGGYTALHIAAKMGNIETVKLLLEDPNIHPNEKDEYGNTALHLATIKGNIEAIKLLLNYYALAKSYSNRENNDGNTALHFATIKENIEAVRLLLARDADVNKKNKNGDTAFHLAICTSNKDLLDSFLSQKNGINLDKCNNEGYSAFHLAALYGNTEIMESLLRYDDFGLNKKNRDGLTPLDIAINYSNKDMVELLVNRGGTSSYLNQTEIEKFIEDAKCHMKEATQTINEEKMASVSRTDTKPKSPIARIDELEEFDYNNSDHNKSDYNFSNNILGAESHCQKCY